MDLDDPTFNSIVRDYFASLEARIPSDAKFRSDECLTFAEIEEAAEWPDHPIRRARAAHLTVCRLCRAAIAAAEPAVRLRHSMPATEWSLALRDRLVDALTRAASAGGLGTHEFVRIDAAGVLNVPMEANAKATTVSIRLIEDGNRFDLGSVRLQPGEKRASLDVSHLGPAIRNLLLPLELLETEQTSE